MNITEAKEHVKNTIETYLAKDPSGSPLIIPARQRPLFIVGAPGIGKTDIMSQIADELGIGLVSYSMTHHTRQSALGLPYIVNRTYDGEEYEVSEYTMSEIIASVHDYCEATGKKEGILFLDEINCVSETLYPSMLQFLQFKTFGRHRVPDGWVVVCAGNPPEYNKSVHEFDIVTLDRLRKIEVEPDYDAWHAYAADTGVHPAIMTFLESKRDCFYIVESTPSGKRFVTARGWVDLSDSIKVFEAMGKKVDKNLIVQFLQDDEIADAFAVYYELFDKYRSDYQVTQILDGAFSDDVVARAKAADFDERLALLGLMLDALCNDINDMLGSEGVLMYVRDELRAVKQPLLDGGEASEVLGGAIARLEQHVKSTQRIDTVPETRKRVMRRAVTMLKEFERRCELEGVTAGRGAFALIQDLYRENIATLESSVKHISSQIDNGFAFIEQAFGDEREMLVYVTELTARKPTTHFITTFGSDAYFKHNAKLLVDKHRASLLSEIEKLDIDAAPREPAVRRTVDEKAVAEYYESAEFEYGFASMCKMMLPDHLYGKTILDIGCRRGRGVYKLSSRVGDVGHVIGLDWSEKFLDEARERSERAWMDSGLAANNMEFLFGYPELLEQAGIAAGSIDVVFVNSVINLAYDVEAAFESIARVLKPGGLLICETAVADRERTPEVVAEAKRIGNSVQASPYRKDYEEMLSRVGFSHIRYAEEEPVDRACGYIASYEVPVAEGDDDVVFKATLCHIRK